MKMIIFSIRDNKSSLYNPPIYATHLAEITRGLEKALKSDSMYASHPQDFELRRLGTFETEDGTIITEKDPVHMLNLIDLKHQTMGEPNHAKTSK